MYFLSVRYDTYSNVLLHYEWCTFFLKEENIVCLFFFPTLEGHIHKGHLALLEIVAIICIYRLLDHPPYINHKLFRRNLTRELYVFANMAIWYIDSNQ